MIDNTPCWCEQTLNQLRGDLMRFARIQLPDNDTAEDVVQETILAAYAHRDDFQGNAQFRTWVFSILKNKITDYLRQKQRREALFVHTEQEDDLDETFEELFDRRGHWHQHSQNEHWHTPEDDVSHTEFLAILEACLYRLPENTARIFMMREILGLDAEEIQQQCGLSASNYYVVMHRAREGLRRCLQIKWFNHQGENKE